MTLQAYSRSMFPLDCRRMQIEIKTDVTSVFFAFLYTFELRVFEEKLSFSQSDDKGRRSVILFSIMTKKRL